MDAPSEPRLPAIPRRTRIALALSLTLLVLTLAGWAFSHTRIIAASRKSGSVVAPGDPGGDPAEWTFLARTLRIAQFPGELSLGLGEYRSLAPKREGLDAWEDWRGWSADMFPASALSLSGKPALHWHSASDFAFFGLGTTEFTRSGETTRVVSAPHWLILTLLAALAVGLWLPHHRRARRAKQGLCPHCAYDRRHTPPNAPCPECGRTRP